MRLRNILAGAFMALAIYTVMMMTYGVIQIIETAAAR